MGRETLKEFDIRMELQYTECPKCWTIHAFNTKRYLAPEFERVFETNCASSQMSQIRSVLKYEECLAYRCHKCGYEVYTRCGDYSPKKN